MYQFDVVTLFPEMFEAVTDSGVTGRARERKLYELVLWNPRSFAANSYRTVDDRPYGGGPGMVMKPEPFFDAVAALRCADNSGCKEQVILLDPAGQVFDHAAAERLAACDHLLLLCGRYEGVDERVVEGLPAEEVSIGDYVLAGGEVPALVVIEAVTRLVPGVIGKEDSHEQDSFTEPALLDHPQFTRPAQFRGMAVPEVLLSGDHGAVERWRREAALDKTRRNRPDLAP